MESIERKVENYAIVFNVNLLRATLIEATEFKDLLEETIADTDKDIIVNLSACEHLDSTFLGVLVSSYKRLKSQNRTLVIIEPIEQSSIFLTLNSIGKIFPLYTSVKVALEDIENKKLLENELHEIDAKQTRKSERQLSSNSVTSTHPLVDSPLVQMQEPIQELEPEITEELFEKSAPEKLSFSSVVAQTENANKFEMENSSEDTPRIESAEPMFKNRNLEYEIDAVKEDIFVSVPQEVIKPDMRFHSGKVEWEFGFSS
ncbi:MAG: STAS domain-containing protein [Ignavibacteriota bacterium]|jgi:anti-anti-sigma factor|nr:MAG: anti-sigma factor antagonist [Chlorobiota bacterium]MBE7475169.1 STAS domain-containing protein [Ignavibacteriales bacterium]MBL1122135.1 anti-sigma factor antagonist [Ignavibacteriota bacterium]MCE7856194.1 anti-sigma factor antagonist [Ignavibacteria bacterium CHB3]MCL4280008.1 STAS domain-containing protein [Ignavibacteriaceae bacterium]MEB2296660.1 STAS domain-containing protein [Ignavibacteria bacterium]